jgi:uncharacterized protein
MNYYALFYDVVDDFVVRRAPYRDEHLGLAREAHARGELILAGALADPADGALLIFRAGDRTVAEHFAREDPYVIHGLVVHWEVRPWTVVIGNDPLRDKNDKPPSPDMIARLWSARTTEPHFRAYLDHVSDALLPRLRGLTGYAGGIVLRRETGGEVEILVATAWRSLEAIREFAGFDLDGAVVADDAMALLTEFDRRVRHYEVVMADLGQGR